MLPTIYCNHLSKGPTIYLKFHLTKDKIDSIQLACNDKKNLSFEILAQDPKTFLVEEIESWLKEYSKGTDPKFFLPLNLEGLSPFAKKVTLCLQQLNFGKKCSYQELAIMSGVKNAVRAAATVCRKNQFPFIIPCHRIIYTNGQIGNYSAGLGMETKKVLLNFEEQKK